MSEESKPSIWKAIASEAALLAAIPAWGYFLVFVYESAYCRWFGLPDDLVTPDLTAVVSTAVVFCSIGGIVFVGFLVLSSILVDLNSRFLGYLRRRWYAWAPMFLVGLDLGASYWRLLFWGFVYMALVLTVNDIIPALWRKRKTGESFWDAMDEDRKVVRKEYATTYEYWRSVGLHPWMILAYLILTISIMVANAAGAVSARHTSEFYIPSNLPGHAVIRIYGNNAICVPFDREQKTVGREFQVVAVASDPVVAFKKEAVGPLKLEKRTADEGNANDEPPRAEPTINAPDDEPPADPAKDESTDSPLSDAVPPTAGG